MASRPGYTRLQIGLHWLAALAVTAIAAAGATLFASDEAPAAVSAPIPAPGLSASTNRSGSR